VVIATAPRVRFFVTGGFDGHVDVYGHEHEHVRVKGNNGRHLGQDGTWARDSGGFKSTNDPRDHDHDHGGGGGVRAKVDVHGGDHGGHEAKVASGDRGGSVKSIAGGSAKSGGAGSVKSIGGGAKSGGGNGGGKGGKH
jgi:hypothetical protein